MILGSFQQENNYIPSSILILLEKEPVEETCRVPIDPLFSSWVSVIISLFPTRENRAFLGSQGCSSFLWLWQEGIP